MLMMSMLKLPLDPAEPRKQATTHINVTSEEVARTTGEQREQWLEAGRKEITANQQLDIQAIRGAQSSGHWSPSVQLKGTG